MHFRPAPLKRTAISAAAADAFGTGGAGAPLRRRGSRQYVAPVALDVLAKPVLALFSGFRGAMDFLMRLFRAIMGRIASTMGVEVEAKGGGDGASLGDASFVSERETGGEQVQEAAKLATAEISEFVERLARTPVDAAMLSGDGAAAYLALVLDELGVAIREMKARISEKQSLNDAVASELALKLGVSAQSVGSMLAAGNFPLDSALGQEAVVKEAVARAKSLEADREKLIRFQFCFCDQCIAGTQRNVVELQHIVTKKITEFADDDMANAISMGNMSKKDDNLNRLEVSSQNSKKEESPNAVGVEPARRKSRAGFQVGVVDAIPDADGEESSPPPRMRN